MNKPKKATLSSPACPHLAIAYEGGGNWGWAYYDSYLKAMQVAEWIKAGSNSKFCCKGRADADKEGSGAKDGKTLYCVHYHYDNTNRPSFIENCPKVRNLWK